MNREWIAFACAVACLIVVPFVANALASRLGRTPDEERWIQALLYGCVNAALIVTIFWLWILG